MAWEHITVYLCTIFERCLGKIHLPLKCCIQHHTYAAEVMIREGIPNIYTNV